MRRVASWIALIFAVFVMAGCAARPQAIIGVDNIAAPAASIPDTTIHRILIATTRARATDRTILFTGERSSGVDFAYAEVSVPPAHVAGQIERSSSRIPDPRRHFVVTQGNYLEGGATFQAAVNGALAQRTGTARSVLIFVHGYNTNLTEALLRTAQFVHDTGFQGVPVLFSWASRGELTEYLYDLNSANLARDGLEQLAYLLRDTDAAHFDVVSHSMGNYLVLETMRQIQLQGRIGDGSRIGSIIMASPDVDIDVFEAQWRRIQADRQKFFILISEDDRALRLSRRLAGGVSRVGNADPELLASMGFNVIDLSRVEDRSSTHHSKFASAPEIVRLVGWRLAQGDRLGPAQAGATTPVAAASIIPDFTVRALQAGRIVTVGGQ